MSEVKSSDLPQWLEALVAKDVKPIKERASYLVSRSIEALGNIRKTATALSEDVSSASSTESSKIEIAKNFGARITGLVDEVKGPETISHETLLSFLSGLRKFHAGLLYAGAIWIRKLDPKYKETIRKMELSLSDIRTNGKLLEEHLDRKYSAVRKYEALLKEAETLRIVSDELVRLEDEIQKIKRQRETLQAALGTLAEDKRQLEASEKLAELSRLESMKDAARREIVNLFRPLEKPVEKLLKLPERERQRLDPSAATILSEYVTNPVEKLCKSDIDYSRLGTSLSGFQSMLERRELDLKDSRIRAALKSISLIKDRSNPERLRKKYLEASEVYEQASKSPEVQSLLLKREEMDSKRMETEEAIGRLDRTLSSMQARKEELSKRFTQLKEGMEKATRNVTGQTIRIPSPLPS